jgi:hypothetical protein
MVISPIGREPKLVRPSLSPASCFHFEASLFAFAHLLSCHYHFVNGLMLFPCEFIFNDKT